MQRYEYQIQCQDCSFKTVAETESTAVAEAEEHLEKWVVVRGRSYPGLPSRPEEDQPNRSHTVVLTKRILVTQG